MTELPPLFPLGVQPNVIDAVDYEIITKSRGGEGTDAAIRDTPSESRPGPTKLIAKTLNQYVWAGTISVTKYY